MNRNYLETDEDFFYKVVGDELHLSSQEDDTKFTVSVIHSDNYGLVWPWSNTDITKVVIEDGIAPSTCENMFKECESLTEVEGLEYLDTSHVTDMSNMFEYCKSLTSLDLSNLDTSHVTDMNSMFYYCWALPDIDGITSLDTSSVTDMNSMFGDCPSLADVDLSGWDTSKVEDMSGMFWNCETLDEIDLSGWDTGSVEDMDGMFTNCGIRLLFTDNQRITNKLLAEHPDATVYPPESQSYDDEISLSDSMDQSSSASRMPTPDPRRPSETSHDLR